MRHALGLLLALAGTAAAAETELLREEAYNYRIVGKLPAGWQRRGARLAYAYSIDKIPHAHIHFVRQRVKNAELDVAAEMRKRESHYRFPGTPEEIKGTYGKTRWAGRDAVLYEFRAKVQGVASYRRVTAIFSKGVWYELIETHYGESTANDDGCAGGVAVFRDGFRLLTEQLGKEAALDTEERVIADGQFGFEITKPAQFVRVEVHTAADPGCRVAFERTAKNGRQHARVRLFEYAVRAKIDPKRWFDVFYTGFATSHRQPRRETTKPPAVPGTKSVWAERFIGTRDKLEVSTLVLLIWADNGRVFVVRIRTQADAGEAFAAGIARVTQGLRFR